ncbi:MAG: hypothetical protein ACI8PQ_003158 [Planctomycetota bacterium]|jgi:hypothetical protein
MREVTLKSPGRGVSAVSVDTPRSLVSRVFPGAQQSPEM